MLTLPSQEVTCPVCKDFYFDDDVLQVCPYCGHEFAIEEDKDV